MSDAEFGSPGDGDPSLVLIAILTLLAVGLMLIAGAVVRSNAVDYQQACRDQGGVPTRVDRTYVCTVNDKIVEVRP